MRHGRALPDFCPVLYEVFLGARQTNSERLEATDYSIVDQPWIITSSAIKCGGPRTGAIEWRSVKKQVA